MVSDVASPHVMQASGATWMLEARRKQERVLPATPLTWISPMHASRSLSAAARSMTRPLAPVCRGHQDQLLI